MTDVNTTNQAERRSGGRGREERSREPAMELLAVGWLRLEAESGRIFAANRRAHALLEGGETFFDRLALEQQPRVRECFRQLASRQLSELRLLTELELGPGRLPVWIAASLAPTGEVEVNFDEDQGAPERAALQQQLEQRTEELAQAERKKDDFLALLAHELRNPLSPIRMAVQLLAREQVPSGSRIPWGLDVIGRQVGQLSRLVDDLLEVARVTRGRVELQRKKVDVADILRRGVDGASELGEQERERLTVIPPAEPLEVDADPARLAQVVGNLLNNAGRHIRQGGEIVLEARRDGEDALIEVRDTGSGIPKEGLPRLFDMYAQADQGAVRTHAGLGVGLALAKGLVELHGGRISAHSAGPGQGSELTVRLAALPRVSRAGPQSRTPSAAEHRRVLVVDDNEDSATTIEMLLSVDGHEVAVAHDGVGAIERARDFAPEVVLLDIGLPRMSGYEVAQQLRAEHGPAMVLIALTGYGHEEDRRRAREAGFDHHLLKPLNLDRLKGLLAAPTPG